MKRFVGLTMLLASAVFAVPVCAANVKAEVKFSIPNTPELHEGNTATSKTFAKVVEMFQTSLQPVVDLKAVTYMIAGHEIRLSIMGRWREMAEAREAADRIRKAAVAVQDQFATEKVELAEIKVEVYSDQDTARSQNAPGQNPSEGGGRNGVAVGSTGSAPAIGATGGAGTSTTAARPADGQPSDSGAKDTSWRPGTRFNLVSAKDGKSLDRCDVLDAPLWRAMDVIGSLPSIQISYCLNQRWMYRSVTVHLLRVPVDVALDAIAESAGLRIDRKGSYLRFVEAPPDSPAGH